LVVNSSPPLHTAIYPGVHLDLTGHVHALEVSHSTGLLYGRNRCFAASTIDIANGNLETFRG
jgi:hypothetical protein